MKVNSIWSNFLFVLNDDDTWYWNYIKFVSPSEKYIGNDVMVIFTLGQLAQNSLLFQEI